MKEARSQQRAASVRATARRQWPPLGPITMFAVLATNAIAAPPADLDATVARAMQTFGVPAMSVAVVEGGKTTVAKGYGVRSLTTAKPADEHTAFPIGSETKAFTAAALAILVDQKKLSWDDRVVDKLPGFQMYDPYVTAHMTVRDLLTHRSGLGLGEGDLLFLPSTTRSRSDIVHALRYLKPVSGFREKFAYDNILYIVGGQLVEAISGQSWESFVTEHIFKPAGMTDAHASYDPSAPNAVSLHARTDGPIRGEGRQEVLTRWLAAQATAPAGGINASALDMARWMSVQLAHGVSPDGTRIFSEQQAAEMWAPVVVVPPTEFKLPPALAAMQPDLQAYALGWFVDSYRGHVIIEHAGAVLGGVALQYLVPDKQLGISVNINSEDGGARRAVLFHLLDYYLHVPSADWVGTVKRARDDSVAIALASLKEVRAVSASPAKPTFPAEDYAGMYRDPWYGDMTVTAHDGKLRIRFDRSPGMEGTLDPVVGDRFRAHWTDKTIEDAFVDFTVQDHTVTRVTMVAVSPLADFSFDYKDLAFTPIHG